MERARAALLSWPASHRGPLRTLHVGENATFRVEAPCGKLALRLYRPGRWTDDAIRVEHAFMEHLGEELGVKTPIPGEDGETLQVSSADCRAALFPWSRGRLTGRPGPSLVRRVAAYLARLHRRCVAFVSPVPRPGWSPGTLLDSTREAFRNRFQQLYPGLEPPDLEASLEEGRTRWLGLDLPVAMVHADFHWGNLKLEGRRFHPLDFDDCGVAPLAYDLATVAYCTPLCRERPGIELLVESYNVGAEFPTTVEAVELLTWARFVGLLGWLLERHELFERSRLAEILQRNLGRALELARRLGLPPGTSSEWWTSGSAVPS